MPLRLDVYCFVVMKDFESVAIEDGDDGARKVGGTDNSWDEQGRQQQEWRPVRDHGRRKGGYKLPSRWASTTN